MPRRVVPLTDTQIKKAKAKDREYSLADGDGLLLRVKPTGSKLWIFNYTHPVTKKRKNMGLGVYNAVTLANARAKAKDARTLVSNGIDPVTHRDNERVKEQIKIENTLLSIAENWLEVKKSEVTEDHASDVWRSLELHVFPNLGNLPISEITAPTAIKALTPLEAEDKLETLKRVAARLNEVMTYAVNTGRLDSNRLAKITDAFKKPKPVPMKSVKPEQVGMVMKKMSRSNMTLITRCAFEFQLHTLTRPIETAQAEWSEINFTDNTWVIPGKKMKMLGVHTIPLSRAALKILQEMKPISFEHSRYIFPSARSSNGHINSQSVNNAIKSAGLNDELVSHGLRSIGSTLLNEEEFNPDLIEVILSHVGKDKIRMAYNRASYIEKRRVLMEFWSEFIVNSSKDCFTIVKYDDDDDL